MKSIFVTKAKRFESPAKEQTFRKNVSYESSSLKEKLLAQSKILEKYKRQKESLLLEKRTLTQEEGKYGTLTNRNQRKQYREVHKSQINIYKIKGKDALRGFPVY
jgi:hypothetical protein